MASVVTTPHAPLSDLTSWYSQWSGLRVAVYGLGATGFAVADTLAELGADVLVVAASAVGERAALLDVIGARLLEHSDEEHLPDELIAFDPELVVVSPGFHPDHLLLRWAESEAVPVWGDIELAWRVRDKVLAPHGSDTPAEWVCVTGTNGKTTTVQLTASFVNAAGLRVAPCGNIGIPVLDAVRDPQGYDVLVVELSSYQLHWINRNKGGEIFPFSSVCLNVAEDHLDWHGSMAAYGAAKAKVYGNTKVACVYNRSDRRTLEMVEQAEVVDGARAISFGLDVPGPSELGIIDDILCDRAFLDDRAHRALELATMEDLDEQGLTAPHILANILAAAALARSLGVEPHTIRDVLRVFRLDPHRIEQVGFSGGVRWVDDSKATNPHAAHASLSTYPAVVWIVGGLFKGVDVAELIQHHEHRLRGAVLIGADRAALRQAFERHASGIPVLEVDTDQTENVMPFAVRLAARLAREGDTVLLAPAAASMDQFEDYAQRGRLFRDAVDEYLGGASSDDQSTTPENSD